MLHHEVNLSWAINKEPVAMSFKTFFSVVSMFHLFIRSWPLYDFCFERINYSNSACISFFPLLGTNLMVLQGQKPLVTARTDAAAKQHLSEVCHTLGY